MTKRLIKLPQVWSMGRVVVATVLDPKNRAFMGRIQVRLIRDTSAIDWLCWYLAPLLPDARVWPASRSTFESMFKRALAFFGLSQIGFTLSSLRAGRATELLELGVPIANIQFMGSWGGQRTLAAYLQEAEAASTLLHIGAQEPQRIRFAVEAFGFLQASPPFAPPHA